MYNMPFSNAYNQQISIDKLNEQISNLEKIKAQMQQPAPITQNFQIAPQSREIMKYASSIEEVQRDNVTTDTPYFSKDMSVVWIKSLKGDIKTYELNEIVPKDDKDIKIEFLEAQIKELKERIENAKPNDEYVDEPVESEEPSNVSNDRTSKKKSK